MEENPYKAPQAENSNASPSLWSGSKAIKVFLILLWIAWGLTFMGVLFLAFVRLFAIR